MLFDCPICALHADSAMAERYEIQRSKLWILRHHPDPAPLSGWLLLDSVRHCSGALDFQPEEQADWGRVLRNASQLVQQLTGCDRVYAIAFGEGAQHLHMHLIPRFVADTGTKAWAVADHYRSVAQGNSSAATPGDVQELVAKARNHATRFVSGVV